MTRLVFVKNQAGNIHTTKEMLAREKVIIGHIIVEDSGIKFIVTDLGSGAILLNGTAKTIALAKKSLKEAFKSYGVLFHDEVRKKLE